VPQNAILSVLAPKLGFCVFAMNGETNSLALEKKKRISYFFNRKRLISETLGAKR